jgi:hypothetical protein
MKKKVCLGVMLVFTTVLMFWGLNSKKQAENGTTLTGVPPAGQIEAIPLGGGITGGLFPKKGKAGSRVYKPKSLQVGSGAATIVEIEHGLEKNVIYTEEMRKGMRKGALAAITLRVVDSQGTPVQGAKLFGGFFNYDRNDPPATGLTDANGEIALKHNCTGDFNFSLTKDGYYDTTLRYWFFKNGFDCAKNGRWLPWNPTVEVPLKEKRNPVPMYTKTITSKMPVYDEPVGFDFEQGDWVAPYGKGVRSDMQLTYSEIEKKDSWRRYDFSVSFTNQQDGAYLRNMDTYSRLRSEHEAKADQYESAFRFVYERTDEKIIQERRITENEMLVFRVRTEANAQGNVVSARYGKIYGPFKFADSWERLIEFSYYLNPTPNDRNLEATGQWP